MSAEPEQWENRVQDIINKMGRAMMRGTGLRLSAAEVNTLIPSTIGDICCQEYPRIERTTHD